jgi:hypothetical protein
MLFRKSKIVDANTSCDDVYIIHFVEHDQTCIVNAPTIDHACMCARQMFHRYTSRPDVYTRAMMYDNNRIAIIMYSNDHEYTCNVMRMRVHDHTRPDEIQMN